MVAIVLGMHRSGTSAVAGALHLSGVWMGDTLLAADHNNPSGYFEDAEMAGLNQILLKCSGGLWWNPPAQEAILEGAAPMRGMMARAMQKRAHRDLWGWKDPRTCLTLPAWLTVLPNQQVSFIRVRRGKNAVLESLLRRHSADSEWWLKRRTENEWAALVDEYEARLDGYGLPMVEVSYEAMLEDPEWELQKVANALDCELSEEGIAHVRRDT